MGFSHVLVFDHVLSAEQASRQPPLRPGGYNETHAFHEVFVLLSYIAAVTRSVGLVTGVLVLPQRQTALMAKQAAEIDLLSGGRLRLGVGAGWNHVEYEALGQRFDDRGVRETEQVQLLRRYWSEPLVTYAGRWDRVERAGLNPLPGRRIPIWLGGFSDAAFKRAVRIADGFILGGRSSDEAAAWTRIEHYLEDAHRDRSSFGLEAIVEYGGDPSEPPERRWLARYRNWLDADADYISVHTMRSGFGGASAHVDALRRYAAEVGLGRISSHP
jgi:probable F420-dependent oxidoreductase